MKHITRILCIGLLALGVAACEKENNPEPTPTPTPTPNPTEKANALVLNEGAWGANNASISGLVTSSGAIDNDWFENANGGRQLGDVAQDMVAYGSKVYATVTFSNSLEVIDPKTGASTRVDMGNRNPRSIAAEGGKIYITCYNPCSVVRVDTASLEIEATCQLGEYHPEGIAIAQGKAFVASSVTEDYQSYDNKVYVIDLATFENPEPIIVGTNPGAVKLIDDNTVLVCYAGNYNDIPAGSALINASTLEVSQTNHELAGATTYNGLIYGYASTWVEQNGEWIQTVEYYTLDPSTLTATTLTFLSEIASPYGIDINPANGDIYVTESISGANGDVHCYSQDGTKRYTIEAGVFPKKVVFF